MDPLAIFPVIIVLINPEKSAVFGDCKNICPSMMFPLITDLSSIAILDSHVLSVDHVDAPVLVAVKTTVVLSAVKVITSFVPETIVGIVAEDVPDVAVNVGTCPVTVG